MLKFDYTPTAKHNTKAFFKKIKKEREEKITGYYELPKNSLSKELKNFLKSNKELKKCKNIVVIGIGGSSLGVKAIESFLKPKNKTKEIIYFENSDPISTSKKLKKITKQNSIFIIISKSGTTIESISHFKTIIHHLNINLNSNDTSKIIVISDFDSPLSSFAKEYKIQEFHIPKNVGGRFSVLSSVGVVPLYLAGFDVKAILNGAKKFLNSFFKGKEKHLLNKAYDFAFGKKNINVIFAYSDLLEDFSKWYVQLWGESLGKINKNKKRVGLTPIGLIGATHQHSFLQLIIEGKRDKTVTFINIDNFEDNTLIPKISLKHLQKTDFINGHSYNTLINAQCEATMQSLVESKILVDKITLDKISEENIGVLIIYYELLTSLVGIMFDINTYNQPGVELGKKILTAKFEMK